MLGHPDMLCNTRLQPSGRLEPRMGWGYFCPHPLTFPSVSLFLASREIYFQLEVKGPIGPFTLVPEEDPLGSGSCPSTATTPGFCL